MTLCEKTDLTLVDVSLVAVMTEASNDLQKLHLRRDEKA